ncbi:MAG: hypothetical protein Q9186_005176 [Xanthomendoza sp. 1 TL-2023]
MSVEVILNTPLADALSNVVQPKLTELGWSTGGPDDSALGEYIILMLVNGKTEDQIAAELSNDLLSFGPGDTGAADFAKWLFEQVLLLNAQISGDAAPQVPQSSHSQAISSYQNGEIPSHDENRQQGTSGTPDAEMNETMDDVQDASIPTGPKSMRNGSRMGNNRLMGQLSKAMDRSGDAILHRVRPQQGTERINMHNRQPPKGPRGDVNRNQRTPSNLRLAGAGNGGAPNGAMAGPLMNASPQQQMALLAMLEEQARMMSQMFSPQQQSFIQGMPQPAINPNFRPGNQVQTQQTDRSLFERVERPANRLNGNSYRGQHNNNTGLQSRNQQSSGFGVENAQAPINGDLTSSMEVESSQKSQPEQPSDTICKFNLKCTKQDCPFAHQSPAAPPGTTLDLSSGCPFGARCQNRKCVMRHPSPSQNPAHSTTEDCRFFPNCTNPTCPFRHPLSTQAIPLCRFGENCTRPGCKFKHNTVMCKFNPCLNAACPYKHADGQRKGAFGDKVWTADGDQEKEHVSERKFIDGDMAEELVVPSNDQAHSIYASRALVQQSNCRLRYDNVTIRHRRFASSVSTADNYQGVTDIAVLGGGITGLASAYYLAQRLPDAQITLFEGSSRLGGWLHSKQIDVGNGNVVFEQGPRTLRPSRPNGWVTLDLIRDLGLEDQVLMTSRQSVAAQNRFIYFPDHLVRLPGPGSSVFNTLYSMFSEPLFEGMFSSMCTESLKPAKVDMDDESIGSFISRRFKPSLADNIVSAGIHGIYAGDIYQLSVRSIMPSLWYAEQVKRSITAGFVGGWSLRWPQDTALEAEWAKAPPASETIQATKDSSVFTFRKGIGQLADRLEAKLWEAPNVTIRLDTKVDELQLEQLDSFPNMTLMAPRAGESVGEPDKMSFTHVISTISGKALHDIVRPTSSLSVLSQTPSVTVMVVNLYFSNPSVLPARGFGYLLPRSLSFEQNPERALGVVFDSDATIGQDKIPGTKVTVMLGGHWWDDWAAFPDEEQGANMAKAILKRHLAVSEEPQAVRVGLQRNCIPQYTVGHHSRMEQANEALKGFKGRLRVAGNSYNGVGLNDCVRSAREVVMDLVQGRGEKTGLEPFTKANAPVMEQKKSR